MECNIVPARYVMMMGDNLKNKPLTAILCALCLLLCGCSATVDDLLTPPKLNAEQNEIYSALINSVGQNVKLKYPRSGDHRSAFVLQNLDDEPDDEAMVFYESGSVQSGESSLRLKFLDKTDGKWEAVYDMACAGSEVDSVSFTTLGNTGFVDIIIRYTLLNQTEKVFSVLKYENAVPKQMYTSSYACLEVYDINDDGQNELLAVSVDKVNNISNAVLFTDGENGFERLSETSLRGGAADYIRVTKGRISDSRTAMFLDYSKGGGQSGTDVLYCYGNSLYCPEGTSAGASANIISRLVNKYMSEIYCYDIDGDGFVEIPSTTPLPGYEALTKPEQLCAVMWYTVSNDKFEQEYYSYFSGKYRFALMFPNRWRGVVSAIPDFDNNEIVFISYDEESGLADVEGTELMRVRAVDKDDERAVSASSGLKKLGETEDMIYFCIETSGYKAGALALTESELQNSFIMM